MVVDCPTHVGKSASKRLGGAPFPDLDSAGRKSQTAWMGLAMNADTNRPDDPDPDDLEGLATSLDHLRLWCDPEGTRDGSAGNWP
jgi:hypothetical protein